MKFHGFQKMTLLDYPGKVACTLFTGGCNLRCPFCHNAPLVTKLGESEVWEDTEILSYLSKRKGLLDGVAVTGGEPLLQPGIADFLKKVRELGFAVKLDTNGTFPDRLRELIDARLLDYVAVDIKNCKEKYAGTVGVPDFDLSPVEETVRTLIDGSLPFEFRTTVVAEFHTPEDIAAIADWIRGTPRYYLQNFTDSGNLICDGLHAVPRETMEEMRRKAAEILPFVAVRGV